MFNAIKALIRNIQGKIIWNAKMSESMGLIPIDTWDYDENMHFIKNPIAMDVKEADLNHNMDLKRLGNPGEKDLERLDKCEKAYKAIVNHKRVAVPDQPCTANTRDEEAAMKYFCTYDQLDFEKHSTNYLQIYWGPFDINRYWAKDSLYINGYVFDEVCGMRLLRTSGALPQFDFYDNTVVTERDWNRMHTVLSALGGKPAEFVEELACWVGDGFQSNVCFIIAGV